MCYGCMSCGGGRETLDMHNVDVCVIKTTQPVDRLTAARVRTAIIDVGLAASHLLFTSVHLIIRYFCNIPLTTPPPLPTIHLFAVRGRLPVHEPLPVGTVLR